MIAVDTNILVYAHREDTPWHKEAFRCIKTLAEGHKSWAIPWPCIHEFLAIVTHPGIFNPPSPRDIAIKQVEAWLESPSLVLLSETEMHWSVLRDSIKKGKIKGPMVHDARVAAICTEHGVKELWSADRDFSRFKGITVKNPLVG